MLKDEWLVPKVRASSKHLKQGVLLGPEHEDTVNILRGTAFVWETQAVIKQKFGMIHYCYLSTRATYYQEPAETFRVYKGLLTLE